MKVLRSDLKIYVGLCIYLFLTALALCGSVRASSAAVMGRGVSVSRGILATQPGIEPPSLALECGFLTTGQPGKFSGLVFLSD